MANTIAARFSLDGFSLNLLPVMNQDQQGNNSLNPSGFTPRIGVYTGDPVSPEYRGEKAYTFSDVPTDPIEGIHKGLKTKDQLFSSPEMKSVLDAWIATASGVLDDTPDGMNVIGSGSLDYRMEKIETTLRYNNLIDNFVLIEFGIYESATSKSRISSVVVKYVPDDLVETQRASSRTLKKQLETAKEEIRKTAIEIAKLKPDALDYDAQYEAKILRIQQAQETIRNNQQTLLTRYNMLFFPLSQLFAESAVTTAIGTMVAGVFTELKTATYLLESYDLSSLGSLDLPGLLYLFAHMQPKP